MNAPDLETIVSRGLCAGCGLCASLAGRDRLEMQLTSYGQIRPQVREKIDPETLEKIRSICPGIRVTGADASQVAVRRRTFQEAGGRSTAR